MFPNRFRISADITKIVFWTFFTDFFLLSVYSNQHFLIRVTNDLFLLYVHSREIIENYDIVHIAPTFLCHMQ